jgi:hypothetical protein
VVLAAAGPTAARAPGWTRYVNARFGFSVEYPAGAFAAERAPDNGDGRKYRAIHGGARLAVWAGHNATGQRPHEWVAAVSAEDCRKGRARYAVTGKAVAVVSCERRGEVLYAKRLWRGDMVTGFQMTYPVGERKRWDLDLTRMAESLKPAK